MKLRECTEPTNDQRVDSASKDTGLRSSNLESRNSVPIERASDEHDFRL